MTEPLYWGLSCCAKMLHGMMLDRVSLSVKSDWVDATNRPYIYFTVAEIEMLLDCGHNKAVRLLVELERYRLIQRKKQGQGKPSKICVQKYVKHAPKPPEEYAALLRDLSAIENNVNQIAHWANAQKSLSEADIV